MFISHHQCLKMSYKNFYFIHWDMTYFKSNWKELISQDNISKSNQMQIVKQRLLFNLYAQDKLDMSWCRCVFYHCLKVRDYPSEADAIQARPLRIALSSPLFSEQSVFPPLSKVKFALHLCLQKGIQYLHIFREPARQSIVYCTIVSLVIPDAWVYTVVHNSIMDYIFFSNREKKKDMYWVQHTT